MTKAMSILRIRVHAHTHTQEARPILIMPMAKGVVTQQKESTNFCFLGFFFSMIPTGTHRILARYRGQKSKN
jgi:hypothetical protein